MAGLDPTPAPPPSLTSPHGPLTPWTAAQGRAQFVALAKLRGAIFLNSFRRKGGAGELVARIIFFPIFAVFAFGPIIGSGFAGYLFISEDRVFMLQLLTWGIFILWMLVLLNISPPGLSFDINTILRFPLSFSRYLTARIFFGLLSVSTVIGTLSLISASIGISVARPSLAIWSTFLLGVFALCNIFFTRMMLVWVERWLSTRRAREILTALILFGSLGFQYLNVNFNPGLQGRHHHTPNRLPLLLSIWHHIAPVAAFLPPGLTSSSIVSFSQGRIFAAVASLVGLIAFTALFFSIYAWRMHREFLGENLSEVTQPNQPPARRSSAVAQHRPAQAGPALTPDTVQAAASTRTFGLNNTVLACLQKEFLYIQRNLNQLYGFIAPLFMVFLFASRMSLVGRFGEFVFPVAVAYSTLGVSTLSYNALGMDGTGVQFYLLSPTRLRDVFLAKNLTMFILTLAELVLIFAVILIVTHAPSLVVALATIAWLLFATFLNAAVGNLRSVIAPRKVDLMKATRKQISQLSALLALAVVAACAGLGASVVLLCNYLDRTWLMIPIFLALAIIAFVVYLQVLNRLDTLAVTHRETLTEELCKA
jgi:ABC-2 type transport system permease protein